MRLRSLSILLIALATTRCLAQDENSEDVFDKPLAKDVTTTTAGSETDDMPLAVPQEELLNEGSDSFETSTEMIEISGNDTSLEVNPIQKTSVFSPITPLDGGVFNFSKATIEEDSMEDLDDSDELKTTAKMTTENSETEETLETSEIPTETTTQQIDVITFSSLPIEVDEVADRRVLKEKEMATATRLATTTPASVAVSDPSESEDEGETPFDQSALEGLFEQDGSVIDSSLTTDQTPAFPILKMKEEDSKILSNIPKTMTSESSSSTITTTEKEPETTMLTESTQTSTETQTTTETETSTPSTEATDSTTSSEESTTSSEDTTTAEELSTIPALQNSSKVFLPAKSIRTPIVFRILSLDFTEEFNDIQSGPSKKLAKDLIPSIGEFINSISGEDNFVNVEIKTLTKGSVVVGAELLTKKSLGDAQMAVNLLEAAFSRNNSMLADYKIDSLSVTVDGMTSQAYIDSISTQTSSYSLSSLMIVIITFALIVIFGLALFIIMITTKRRRQSTMKLSMDDTIRSNTPDSNDTPHNVHLMSYGTTPRTAQRPGPITKTQIDETSSPMY
ncbi:hypothetical protein GCK72_001325 [Caenorhabditis remanei]|uniref:SEA domain-containing protein n=1 Tax=Caenorhabditis remanei TaxID=31234 RepID=A0A6A5HNM6_CAERE|nr:hypothetical protein GCK72_001325 [Caenorhabditis remanei]KAF1769508.1 hypothetical protein GCK72_001325 [Caenorhabditis remanei]